MSAPKKSLGQHWLHDEATLNYICDAAELVPTDTVLEIGPGTGTLTKKLLSR
ncbi:MAG: rRNA adenine N-6-methyltransferase family protein, partial [Patescibacteria group bacterium]